MSIVTISHWINPSYADLTLIQDTNLVIIVPADGLAPSGARPSAGTVMTTKFTTMFRQLFINILYVKKKIEKNTFFYVFVD